jgi:hypothetical protein
MTQLISENKYGKLHKLKRSYIIEIDKTVTPFGINKSYNKLLVCWYIDNSLVSIIRHYEEEVMNIFKKMINSKISKKEPYSYVLETQVNPNLSSSECIEHNIGEIVSYYDVKKKTMWKVIIECDIVMENDNNVVMIWNIKKLMRYEK